MTPSQVTTAEIAKVSGLTRKHVRRMITRAANGRSWCGADMRLTFPEDGDVLVEFHSLPDHIREAFVMLDQQELPLPPLERIKLECRAAARDPLN
ncbi:hypothetical protein AIOL_000931 [Candidatus Rhodobacter oscarellae]|uniref:Uncharacterized protein n=1 Tax=Candidatus Rhodobacter oscarellae TaxID=1675527 RepID=A0A0J9EDS1_9RHOB|nr:hypothetical protein [Candidatus Rhodobacter lobularis]KMW60766.1 hypothetical protein AIOL_000931 [Candidatus Rhodobacter lobularis]